MPRRPMPPTSMIPCAARRPSCAARSTIIWHERGRSGAAPPHRRARPCGTAWRPCSARSTGCTRMSRPTSRATMAPRADRGSQVGVERKDVDEMIANLVETPAKYGGARVFVTVEPKGEMTDILVEDDGPGIPEQQREAIFQRGARLDTDKPGTGLGLAIVRDVAEIYGGRITLEESEDLGGLLARLTLPAG